MTEFSDTPNETAEDNRQMEIRRLHRLLREIADLAHHASITGSLQGGARSAVRPYNMALQRLGTLGISAGDLFQPLPEDTGFDELGVDCRLLAGYLKEDVQQDEERHARHKPLIGHGGDFK